MTPDPHDTHGVSFPTTGIGGIDRHNWLNVKYFTGPKWLGQVGIDSRRHVLFLSPDWGIRAGVKILWSYRRKHCVDTVRGILDRWAPSTDTIGSLPGAKSNDPGAYAAFVCKRAKVGPDEPLGLFHDDGRLTPRALTAGKSGIILLPAILRAMTIYECGTKALPFMHPGRIDAGIEIYRKETAERS
jgi:hypothetical protein